MLGGIECIDWLLDEDVDGVLIELGGNDVLCVFLL